MSERGGVSDQIQLIREEMSDLDRQVAEGEIDAATAAELTDRYAKQIESLEQRLDGDAAGPESDASSVTAPRRVSGRVLVGAGLVGAAIVAIAVLAVVSLDGESTQGAEGLVGDIVAGDATTDLSQISNEQMEEVVAENPDVVGMRLALARRYFEEREFDRALDHYFEVLDREQHPEALANIGWMTYLSDRPDIAVEYLEASLAIQPDYLPAQWFIANVYVTLGRPDEAVAYLVVLIPDESVPQEIRDGAATLLEQIEGSP